MKEFRKQISVALIQKINGTIGNLLQDVKHNDEETMFWFGRLIKSPEIYVSDKSIRYVTKDNYLTVLLVMDNNNLIIIKDLNNSGWEVYYSTTLQNVDVDTTFNELCNAIGYH